MGVLKMNEQIKRQKSHNKKQEKHFALITKVSIIVFLCCILLIAKIGVQLFGSVPDSILPDVGTPFSQTTHAKGMPTETPNGPGSETGWQLILVNHSNSIPEDYQVKLTKLRNNQSVDSRIYPALQDMFDDMREAGLMPVISSSYRTTQKQQSLLDEKIAAYKKEGYSDDEAEKLARKWVAPPGTSEHQLGMAVDITSLDRNEQNPSVIWKWLLENSYKYGFILRYPEGKEDITGTIYEPWHFRYVGGQAAREIMEQGICLEEYLE